jgi:hypothetical protein
MVVEGAGLKTVLVRHERGREYEENIRKIRRNHEFPSMSISNDKQYQEDPSNKPSVLHLHLTFVKHQL